MYYDVTGEKICLNPPAEDLNGDCKVDLGDFAVLAENWLKTGLYPLD